MSNVNIIEKNGTDYYYEDTAARNMLGYEQDDTLVAKKAFVAGEFFWYNNKLYKVTADVAQGATFVVNTNCVETNIGTEVKKDNAPTSGSSNSVESGGVYSAIQDVYEVMGENGAKNIIPFNLTAIKSALQAGTWSGNAYTLTDTTFTFNDDGSVRVQGTPAATRYVRWNITVPKGNWKLSGGIDADNFVGLWSGSSYAAQSTNVEGSVSVNAETTYGLTVRVGSSASAIDETFYPMLRDAKDTDSTYQPYAMTNAELTESLNNNTYITTGLTYNKCNLLAGGYCKVGSLVVVSMRLEATENIAQWDNMVSGLPNSDSGTSIGGFPICAKNTSNNNLYLIDVYNSNIRNTGTAISSGQIVVIEGTYLCTK